jgi:hypothetical protein
MLLSLMFALLLDARRLRRIWVSVEGVALNYLSALNSGHKLRRARPLRYSQPDRVRSFCYAIGMVRGRGKRMRLASNGSLCFHMA